MDAKAAVKNYQFGERAKSELIICSQLSLALGDFREGERDGGKRMLIMLLEAVRSETEFAFRSTENMDFRRSVERISEAIGLVESEDLTQASLKVSEAISAATTAAQNAWQVLQGHGLL